MPPDPSALIERIISTLISRPGILGLAVIGSRAGADPSRLDEYSDLDLFVCCDQSEREELLTNAWIREIVPPVLEFPTMDDEIRLLLPDLFQCEVHFASPDELEQHSGACHQGTLVAAGFRIVHDPRGLLAAFVARVSPEPSEMSDPNETSRVFWYNMVYCANLVARGDLFRAALFTHWYLQIWLLEHVFPIGHDAEKYVQRRLTPEQYRALTRTFGHLTPDGMRTALANLMGAYWLFQRTVAPDLDPDLLTTFRRLQADIEHRLKKNSD